MLEGVIVSNFIKNASLTANNCTIQHFILYEKELLHWANGVVSFSMVIYFLLFSVWMTSELIHITF